MTSTTRRIRIVRESDGAEITDLVRRLHLNNRPLTGLDDDGVRHAIVAVYDSAYSGVREYERYRAARVAHSGEPGPLRIGRYGWLLHVDPEHPPIPPGRRPAARKDIERVLRSYAFTGPDTGAAIEALLDTLHLEDW